MDTVLCTDYGIPVLAFRAIVSTFLFWPRPCQRQDATNGRYRFSFSTLHCRRVRAGQARSPCAMNSAWAVCQALHSHYSGIRMDCCFETPRVFPLTVNTRVSELHSCSGFEKAALILAEDLRDGLDNPLAPELGGRTLSELGLPECAGLGRPARSLSSACQTARIPRSSELAYRR